MGSDGNDGRQKGSESTESESVRFCKYLRDGIQVRMVPWIPVRRNPSQDGSVNTWETESKSQDGSVKYLWDGIQVRMVPWIPGRRNPSQDGSVNTCETESKSGWFREYLWDGIQVRMVPWIPVRRNPSQDGSVNTCETESKSGWFREYLWPIVLVLFSSNIISITVGWVQQWCGRILGEGHQNQRGSRKGKGVEGLNWGDLFNWVTLCRDRVCSERGVREPEWVSRPSGTCKRHVITQNARVPRVRNAETRNRRWITLTIRWNASQNAQSVEVRYW